MSEAPQSLAGKTALITGGAVRLGRATALAVAGQGADVVIHYHRSAAEAETLAEEIGRLGRRSWTLGADLADGEQAEGLMGRAIEAAGGVDILVNNASIYPTGRIDEVTAADIAVNMQIHAVAPLMLSRGLAGQGRGGKIVNFLDSRVGDYDRHHAAYHLSKRMLLTLTRMLALELAPAIAVNGVAPGLILPPAGQDPEAFEKLAGTNPMQRVGSSAEVTDAVLLLLRSEFITGQVIFVDGGRHMKGCVYG